MFCSSLPCGSVLSTSFAVAGQILLDMTGAPRAAGTSSRRRHRHCRSLRYRRPLDPRPDCRPHGLGRGHLRMGPPGKACPPPAVIVATTRMWMSLPARREGGAAWPSLHPSGLWPCLQRQLGASRNEQSSASSRRPPWLSKRQSEGRPTATAADGQPRMRRVQPSRAAHFPSFLLPRHSSLLIYFCK